MTAGLAALLEVLLVIVLRRVESGRRRDLGYDRLPARFLPRLERRGCGRLLAGIIEEDRRPVLAAQIPTLTVECCRVVIGPEDIQKLLIGHLCRVKVDLDGLGMTGIPATDLPVRGVLGRAAGVADGGGRYARNLAKRSLDTPETAGCKSSLTHAIKNQPRRGYVPFNRTPPRAARQGSPGSLGTAPAAATASRSRRSPRTGDRRRWPGPSILRGPSRPAAT